jgi:Outer membrane protein beta-barrel domain
MVKRLVIAIALLVTPAFAQAQEIYVGGGLGSRFEAGTPASNLGSRPPGTSTTGDRYKLFAGVGFGRQLAVEASYYDFGGSRCCDPIVADFGFDVATDGYSAAVVGRLPLGRIDLFGKLGRLWWEESGHLTLFAGRVRWANRGNDLLTGAGVGFRLTDHVVLRGEWERFEFADNSSDGVWAAAQYRF